MPGNRRLHAADEVHAIDTGILQAPQIGGGIGGTDLGGKMRLLQRIDRREGDGNALLRQPCAGGEAGPGGGDLDDDATESSEADQPVGIRQHAINIGREDLGLELSDTEIETGPDQIGQPGTRDTGPLQQGWIGGHPMDDGMWQTAA